MGSEAGGVARKGVQRAGRRAAQAVRRPVGRWFWPRWIAVSVVAWMGGLAVVAEAPAFELGVVRSGSTSDYTGWGVAWAVLLGGLLCGATLGSIQWLLLQGHRVPATWWVLASTAGFALGYAVVWALGGAGYGEAYGNHALPHSLDGAGLPGGALLGALLGAAQWSVLRRSVARAGWWVPANAVGFAAGWALAAATSVGDVLAHFVGGALLGAVLGAVTGGVLRWLLAQPARPKRPPEPAHTGRS
jgi:hypothetical protein